MSARQIGRSAHFPGRLTLGDPPRRMREHPSRSSIQATLLTVAVLLWPATASANAGLPMLVIVWPVSWLLYFPIVLIEMVVATRVLETGLRQSLRVSAIANLASTLVGIPFAWGAALVLELGLGGALSATDSEVGTIHAWLLLLLTAPWPGPSTQPWMVLASAIVLCVPFFFASVLAEALVARRLLPEISSARIQRWVWRSNMLSYGGIVVLLAVTLGSVLANGG